MSRTPYLDLNIPDKSSKGFVVTDVFEPNFTKLDQEAERINLRKMSTEDNIEELKKANRYKLGDVVEVLGFHAKGDGSHHKRIAKAEDDGSGEKGQNDIWWCIVHSGEVNVSWFGAKGDGVTDDTVTIQKAFDFASTLTFKYTGSSINAFLETIAYPTICFNGGKRYKINGTINFAVEKLIVDLKGCVLVMNPNSTDFQMKAIGILSSKEFTLKNGGIITGNKFLKIDNENRQGGKYSFHNLRIGKFNKVFELDIQSSVLDFNNITEYNNTIFSDTYCDLQIYKNMWLNGFDATNDYDSHILSRNVDYMHFENIQGIPQFKITPRKKYNSWVKIQGQCNQAKFVNFRAGGENGGMTILNYEAHHASGGQETSVYSSVVTFENCQSQKSNRDGITDSAEKHCGMIRLKSFPNILKINNIYGNNQSNSMVDVYKDSNNNDIDFNQMIENTKGIIASKVVSAGFTSFIGVDYKIDGLVGFRGQCTPIDDYGLSILKSLVVPSAIPLFGFRKNNIKIQGGTDYCTFDSSTRDTTITIPLDVYKENLPEEIIVKSKPSPNQNHWVKNVIKINYSNTSNSISQSLENKWSSTNYLTLKSATITGDKIKFVLDTNNGHPTNINPHLTFVELKSDDNFVFTRKNISIADTFNIITNFNQLDTPYYTLKMQQEGIYEDYVAYRDELHEYENSITTKDATMLPVLQEPVIPESVRVFAEKYKLI